jgi:hypothetical protein
MRTEIIEILQKKYPEYCMQHIDTADEILRLFSVVKQSEPCDHDYQDDSACGVSIKACKKMWRCDISMVYNNSLCAP